MYGSPTESFRSCAGYPVEVHGRQHGPGRIAVAEVGEVQHRDFDSVRAELTSILDDPELPFDRARILVDPRSLCSELGRVMEVLMNKNVARIELASDDQVGLSAFLGSWTMTVRLDAVFRWRGSRHSRTFSTSPIPQSSPMPANPGSRPWRRFLCFSTRGMIVLVLLVSAGLGWLVRSARIPREAVAAITEAGGTIEYDWEWHDGKEIPGGTPWAPPWLVNAIGVDFFGHITFVELYATANDAVLVEVGRLARPQAVILTNSPVSDVGLEHLTGLTNLSRLDLSLTKLTDSGLAH